MTVQNVGGVKWLTKAGFQAYQEKHFSWDADKSASEFERMLTLPHVQQYNRTMREQDKRVPAMMAPQTQVKQGRTLATTFSSASTVSTARDAELAMEAVASVGSSASALHDFGDDAAVFRPDCIAGSSTGQAIAFGEFKAPRSDQIADESAWQGLLPAHKCTPEEQASLASVPQRPRNVRSKLLVGVTGEALRLREEGVALCANILGNTTKRNNVARKLAMEYKRER